MGKFAGELAKKIKKLGLMPLILAAFSAMTLSCDSEILEWGDGKLPTGTRIISEEEFIQLYELGSMRLITQTEYQRIFAVAATNSSANAPVASSPYPVMPLDIKEQKRLSQERFASVDNQRRLLKTLLKTLPTEIQAQAGSSSSSSSIETMSFEEARKQVAALSSAARAQSSLLRSAAGSKIAGNQKPSSHFSIDCSGDEDFETDLHSDMSQLSRYLQPIQNGLMAQFDFPLRNSLTCVKNQGNRGTCVAFASVAAMEIEIAATMGRFVNLSEQDLYSHAKNIWTRVDMWDGLQVGETFDRFDRYYLPKESVWPYNTAEKRLHQNANSGPYSNSCIRYPTILTSSCSSELSTQDACVNKTLESFLVGIHKLCSDFAHQAPLSCYEQVDGDKNKHHYCGFAGPVRTGEAFRVSAESELWDSANKDTALQTIETFLNSGKPVVFSIQVPDSFYYPDAKGFIAYDLAADKEAQSGGLPGHAITAVGFISNAEIQQKLQDPLASASGDGYIIIKNSWSSSWGDRGYAYIHTDWLKEYLYSAVLLSGEIESRQF